MKSPRVSFIVVTHARPQWLSRALESIRHQTIDDYEIIVVVNGPDSKTQQILRRFGSDVRTTVLDNNYGVGAGRNAGIALAEGGLLFFIDDDAALRDRDSAARALAHFKASSDLGIVGFLVIDVSTGAIDRRCLPFRDKHLPERMTEACYFCGGACVINRRVFDQVGLYDESLFYIGEELDLSYRALEAGFRIFFDPSVVVMHDGVGGHGQSSAPYFHTRNRPWVALRHLPLPFCLTHCFAWWGWSLARGFRGHAMGMALRAIRDCLLGMPAIWHERRPLRRSTRQLLALNKGRLWY